MNRRHLRLATSLALVLMLTGAVENNSYAQENVFDNAIKVAIETKPVEVKDEWYIEELPLTKSQQKYVVDLCKEYDFDPLLVYAVMKKESNFNIKCKSETSDFGIMQLNSSNFKWLRKELNKDLDFMDFEDNVLAGVFMLNHYREAWKYSQGENEKKHMIYFLNSYNMGVKGFKQLVSSRGGNYNREYSSDILEYYKQFMLGNFN